MKKKWSRKAALLLAAVTILTSLPTEYLYAAQTQETHDTVTPEEQSNEETVVDTALTGQESVTDTEQETTETVEGTTATEEIADGTEAAGEIETQSLDSQTAVAEDVQEAQDLLNYLVLDNAYIAVGGTQNVVVNIGEDTLTISGCITEYLMEQLMRWQPQRRMEMVSDFQRLLRMRAVPVNMHWTLSFMRKMVRNIRLIYLMQEWMSGLVSIQKWRPIQMQK